MTGRQAILEKFQARLAQISQANGFATDGGQTLFLGETPELGEGDPDSAIAIVVGDDTTPFVGEHVQIKLAVLIQAIVKVDVSEPWVLVEQLLGDIKRAIETADRTLDGLLKRQRIERGPTRTIERPIGSAIAGVSVTYTVPYAEQWGNP